MADTPRRRRSFVFVVLSALAAAGAVTLIVAIQLRRQSIDQWPWAVGLLGLAGICFALYWGPVRLLPVSGAPALAPADRAFKVVLRARGGWLSRYLAPDTDAHLVILDDELRLWWRRPHNEVSLAFWMLMLWGHLPWLNPRWMLWPRLAATLVVLVIQFWFQSREIDLRYPWSRVHSVSVGETRFHIRVDDDEFPDGFLVQVPIGLRKPIATLFAARTSFHDEEANLAKSIREAGTSTSHS